VAGRLDRVHRRHRPAGGWWGTTLLLVLLLQGPPVPAALLPVVIIIDDLGRDLALGERVLALPGPVACAFLPHEPYTVSLAERAHAGGKEVLLHLPMQAVADRPLDAGGLTLDMTRWELRATLARDLALVPHVSGVNNHMGSLMTRHPGDMAWLMDELRTRGLFFVDSRTTRFTVARQVARERGVPSLERDVFLDPYSARHAPMSQFRVLVGEARRQGYAVAIGHPYPATLDMLERVLPRLRQWGITLVSIHRLLRDLREEPAWRLSSYPLPPASRKSRPSP